MDFVSFFTRTGGFDEQRSDLALYEGLRKEDDDSCNSEEDDGSIIISVASAADDGVGEAFPARPPQPGSAYLHVILPLSDILSKGTVLILGTLRRYTRRIKTTTYNIASCRRLPLETFCARITNENSYCLEESPSGGGGNSGVVVPQDEEEEAVIQGRDQGLTSSDQPPTNPVAEKQGRSEDCSTLAESLTDEVEEATTTSGTTTKTTAGTTTVVPSARENNSSSVAGMDDLAVSRAGAPATEEGSVANEPATRPSCHHDLQPVGAGGDSGITARVRIHLARSLRRLIQKNRDVFLPVQPCRRAFLCWAHRVFAPFLGLEERTPHIHACVFFPSLCPVCA